MADSELLFEEYRDLVEGFLAVGVGERGVGQAAAHLRGSHGSGDAGGLTQRMIDAGRRVDDVLARVGPPACRVLAAILEPGVTTGRPADWRAAIQSVTSESRAEAQSALLRFACQALADVYDAMDAKRAR
jgi:hypothetical protein